MEIQDILRQFTVLSTANRIEAVQLKHEEDDAPYRVWRIDTDEASYILKEAKAREAEIYRQLLVSLNDEVPTIYETLILDDKTYLLMEYIIGEDLRKCNRRKLTFALDALIAMQKKTWESKTLSAYGDTFADSLCRRQNRGKYLHDAQLEEAYGRFLQVYKSVPRTLCHDDLLPFNIIVSDHRAVLIDWECGGILPYPVAFARLIAFGEETEDTFFYMTRADKDFAIDYYFRNLLQEKGITYADWRRALDYFLFYEACEWVYVGNRYEATDGAYYQKYLPIAKAQAQKLLHGSRTSNYDISRDTMEAAFATYDPDEIIQRYHLKHDNQYLYLNFVGREYRICRSNGRVEWFSNSENSYIHAAYNECAPIFDMLTYSKTPCSLSGQFVTSNELPGTIKGSAPDAGVFSDRGKRFAGRSEDLKRALAKLGGEPYSVGDVSAIVPMFDFFPVMVQFWDADEEFDAVLKLMWDKHATAFMRYESIAIAAGHLLQRLLESMEEIRKEILT